MDVLTLPFPLGLGSSPPSSSFPPFTLLLFFPSITNFFLFLLFYLFIYLSIFLSFCFIYMLFLVCLTLGIGFTFPGCCTSQYQGATTLLRFPPTTLKLHQPYWLGSCLLTPITLHLSLYKPHTKS
jgi:hypothetical protein